VVLVNDNGCDEASYNCKVVGMPASYLEVFSINSTMKSCVLPKPFVVLPVYTLRLHVTNLYILPSHHPILVLSYLIFGYKICTYPKSKLR